MTENYQNHPLGDLGNTAEQMDMMHEEDLPQCISPPPRQLPPMPPGQQSGGHQGNPGGGYMDGYLNMNMGQFNQSGMSGAPGQGFQPPPNGNFNQFMNFPGGQFPNYPPNMNQSFNQQGGPFPQQGSSFPATPTGQGMGGQMGPQGGFPPMGPGGFPFPGAPGQMPQFPGNSGNAGFGGPQQGGAYGGKNSFGGKGAQPVGAGGQMGFDQQSAGGFSRGGDFGRVGGKDGERKGAKDSKGKGKGKGRDMGVKGDRDMRDMGGKGDRMGKGRGKGDRFGKGKAENLPENCSQLLYDFRMKGRKVELLDVVPHVVEFAKDQYGSRLIQSKLAVCTPDEKQLLYVAIKKEVKGLVLDPFANYVIQKFFEFGTLTQRRGLAAELRGNVLDLSFHMFGCWVMQRALEFLEGPGNSEQILLANELSNEVLRLVSNQNGNHVIQKCIEKMPTDQVQFIIEAFRGEVKRMARHTYGCRVLQRLIEHCVVDQLVAIVAELIDEIEELAKDEYGNYVIQSIAERIDTPHRPLVLQTICEKILDLSTDKYASNVCEKALVYSSDEDRAVLMNTVLGDPTDENRPLLVMMRDRYANYIVQKMIELADPAQKSRLGDCLKDQIENLRKFTYGKHIVGTLVRVGIIDRDQELDLDTPSVRGD